MVMNVCDICKKYIDPKQLYKLSLQIDDDVKAAFPLKKEISRNMDLCYMCANNLDIHIGVVQNRNYAYDRAGDDAEELNLYT